jgi:serine/threonine protein kinase
MSRGGYTSSVDMWSVGCILGELLQRAPRVGSADTPNLKIAPLFAIHAGIVKTPQIGYSTPSVYVTCTQQFFPRWPSTLPPSPPPIPIRGKWSRLHPCIGCCVQPTENRVPYPLANLCSSIYKQGLAKHLDDRATLPSENMIFLLSHWSA